MGGSMTPHEVYRDEAATQKVRSSTTAAPSTFLAVSSLGPLPAHEERMAAPLDKPSDASSGQRVGQTENDSRSNVLPFPNRINLVHEEGLEPPHLAVPEPKSGASANSATRA